MTGKCYYLTSLADWHRHTGRFANSHFVVLDGLPDSAQEKGGEAASSSAPPSEIKIAVLIEADEGVHLSLEDEPAFEALPHPLAQKPISQAAQTALAPHGVQPGATTFDATEALARVHPLLRHRVF